MNMQSLKVVDIVLLTAVVLSFMFTAGESMYIVTRRWIYSAVRVYLLSCARK